VIGMDKPVCSVCVANYNGLAMLAGCLDSVLHRAAVAPALDRTGPAAGGTIHRSIHSNHYACGLAWAFPMAAVETVHAVSAWTAGGEKLIRGGK